MTEAHWRPWEHGDLACLGRAAKCWGSWKQIMQKFQYQFRKAKEPDNTARCGMTWGWAVGLVLPCRAGGGGMRSQSKQIASTLPCDENHDKTHCCVGFFPQRKRNWCSSGNGSLEYLPMRDALCIVLCSGIKMGEQQYKVTPQ